ncbi:hypothetical protein, partial [Caballeronia grimmiae]|uniref:hypothetical protein n=1 Tax=Caballeronia grimmiae TaxID=1071679 RepID=UPI0012689726
MATSIASMAGSVSEEDRADRSRNEPPKTACVTVADQRRADDVWRLIRATVIADTAHTVITPLKPITPKRGNSMATSELVTAP